MISDPITQTLAQQRTVPPPSRAEPTNPSAPAREEAHIPASISVTYWEEEDKSWGAHITTLGVSAVAGSEGEIFGATVDAVEEFWAILNDEYATLSDELRRLLLLRHQELTFQRRA